MAWEEIVCVVMPRLSVAEYEHCFLIISLLRVFKLF